MQPSDGTTLSRIASDLSSNLIVEAGAGTGKTYALVSRLVALIKDGVRMRDIVAITFTEAAAAELSERIRTRIEQLLDELSPENATDLLARDLSDAARALLSSAVSDLDQATIQTIHSFAAQLLRERPLDAGLPPGWTVLDEIESSQRLADRWESWLERVLGGDMSTPQELADALRFVIKKRVGIANWRKVAEAFSENRHRLPEGAAVVEINLHAVAESTLQQLNELVDQCSDRGDRLFEQLMGAVETVEAIGSLVDDPIAAARALDEGRPVNYSGNVGSARNWSTTPKEVRDEFREIGTGFQGVVRVAAIAPILTSLGEFARESEVARKADGVATYDDLLVWARDLLRDNPSARRHLQSRYSHILIDEFQDTDPLQAEIAFHLAAEPDADVRGRSWETLPLSPGKLFVVGDDKQAIYRFRGADIGVAQRVKDGGQLHPLTLTENRRSQGPVLTWVNAVFGEHGLMTESPGVQARYLDLVPHDALQREEIRASVQLFGEQVGLSADQTRALQARHLANIVVAFVSGGDSGLHVYDSRLKRVRQAALSDICILIRSRTGLGILTRGLEDAGVPYRIEGGSLLFDTQEVRDLLNCLRAIDDPSDEVSVVAALRSPAFACSDLALAHWRDAGGPWNYMSTLVGDERLSDGGREKRRLILSADSSLVNVRTAMQKMREYHERRQHTDVSRLIAEFIRERRLDELDLAESRPRETWRRRRFVTEQARALEYGRLVSSEELPLSLYHFLRWVETQQDERARISEVVVPDTDDDAVRIMTMHASKGLEFPIVFLLGLNQGVTRNDEAVLFDSDTGAVEAKLGPIETQGFSAMRESEGEHSRAELVRLAYVAATRARDHLFVSMYRSARQSENVVAGIDECLPEMQDLFEEVSVDAKVAHRLQPAAGDEIESQEYAPAVWMEERNRSLSDRALPRAVTATGLARVAAAMADHEVDEIDNKDGEPDEEQPVLRGRGGTAFGSALHAVLQEVVEQLAEGLPLDGDTKGGDVITLMRSEIERLAEVHASAYGISSSVGELVTLTDRALRHPVAVSALMAPRLWSEIPVAAQVETDGGPVVVEGIIDLLYADDDGELVIVDYKSDYIDSSNTLSDKVDLYRWQGAAYAAAVEIATGRSVKDVQLLFVRANEARSVPGLRQLIGRMPEVVSYV